MFDHVFDWQPFKAFALCNWYRIVFIVDGAVRFSLVGFSGFTGRDRYGRFQSVRACFLSNAQGKHWSMNSVLTWQKIFLNVFFIKSL